MGFKDVGWAYSLKLPTSQKVILAAIAHAIDDETHQTHVSQKTLAEMVGMSVATVNASVRVLDREGIISLRRRTGAGGYRTTDVITINTAYVGRTNVGETNVGDTHIGETDDLHQSYAPPTSTSLYSRRDQPVNTAIELRATAFDDLWKAYPSPEAKQARGTWDKAFRRGVDPDDLVEYITTYAAGPHRHPLQFVKHASA